MQINHNLVSVHMGRKDWLKFCLLFATGCLSVYPTLWGNFVFDDDVSVVKNGVVSHKHPIQDAFTRDFWGVNISHPHSHKSYRPFTTLTYRFDYGMWGLSPFPYHLENLLIHGVNCGLVYFFLMKCLQVGMSPMKRSSTLEILENISFRASLLFAVHPVHVEPLGGVVGRADLFSALVFMLGFLLVPEEIGRKSYLLLTVFSIVGSLFKETAITLVIFYISLQFMTKDRFDFSRRKCLQYTAAVLGSGLFVIWRLWFQGGSPVFQPFDNPPVFASSYFTKVCSIVYVWSMNVFILLNPIWLCYDWSGDCIKLIESYRDIRIFSILLFIGCCCKLWMKSFQNRFILVSCILFGATFLPSSNLMFTVGFVVGERNLYLPSIGFALLISYVIYAKGSDKILMFVLVILMSRSIHRSHQWTDQSYLFISGAQVCPNNAKIHYNLGTMYSDKGDAHSAEKSYKLAITIRSDYYQAMNNLGNILRSKNKTEAEYWLSKAVNLKPDFAAAWMNLGIVLSKKNQSDALVCYKNALKFRKVYPDCEYNLGNLYMDMKNNDAALECWTRATLMKPQHVHSWINRIILLEQEDKLQDAQAIALAALKSVPKSDTLHFLLGNILGKLSDFETAELHFIKAIEISTQNGQTTPAKYFSNLGVLYHRWGKKDLAIEAYTEALKIFPGSSSVRNNLRLLRTSS